jgi:glycerol-3-phosphate acyltransferase PlsY
MSPILIILAILGAWLLASVVVALLIGRAIKIADQRETRTKVQVPELV